MLIIDIHINETYGDFKIISRDISKSRQYYFIQCLCCGRQENKSVRLDNIKRGRQCFCKRDLTGQTFGFLKVLSLDEEQSKKLKSSYYFCQCQHCKRNKIISVKGSSLKNGNTKSCGCLNDDSHRKNLQDKIFGTFKIIDVNYEKTYNLTRASTGTYWNAFCIKCGQNRILCARDLAQNKIPVCDCEGLIKSKGERLIESILLDLGIKHEREKTFPDFITKDFGKPRFDFYFKDIIIEYNGVQHYEPIEHFGGEKEFQHRQYLDDLKRQYCKKHNIKLIEIPYWDFDKINKEYLLNLLGEK